MKKQGFIPCFFVFPLSINPKQATKISLADSALRGADGRSVKWIIGTLSLASTTASSGFNKAKAMDITSSITNPGRLTLSTQETATLLNRKPQTLRKWACLENGPIRPIRINGRLAWRVSEIASLLNGEVAK